mgnify:CR=1 FL=1
MKQEKLKPLNHKEAEDKREKEMVRQFREKGMNDLAEQVQARIDKRNK